MSYEHLEQDPQCHHEGVECEKPCDTHCPCDDCQDDEVECEHEGDEECKHCGADLSAFDMEDNE